MDTPKVGPMSRTLASKTKQHYVCSGCWSELIIVPDKTNPQLDLVKCLNCDCPGYVSKSYVERAKSESYARASDARNNLREAVPFLNKNAGKQISELLAEIGYQP